MSWLKALDWSWLEARFAQHYAITPAQLATMPERRLVALLAALPDAS